jgi:pimeloyl-ACP methyl ester carboxylesterase
MLEKCSEIFYVSSMVAQAVRFTTHAVLRLSGFKFELRRRGHSRIGLWKKTKRKIKSNKSQFPKRFVLIPGFIDGSIAWMGVVTFLLPVLRTKYDEIVVIDYPGFTGALAHEKPFDSFDRMMDLLQDTLVSLRPHTVMGHSMGGWIALLFATRSQTNSNYSGPKRVILTNPASLFVDKESREEWANKFRRAIDGDGPNALRPYLFAKEPVWFKMKWIEREFENILTKKEIASFIHSFHEHHHLKVEDVSKLKDTKVYLIWSEKDGLHPVEGAYYWYKKLKDEGVDAKVLVLKKLGHSPHIENPTKTAAAIAQAVLDHDFYGLSKRWIEEPTVAIG